MIYFCPGPQLCRVRAGLGLGDAGEAALAAQLQLGAEVGHGQETRVTFCAFLSSLRPVVTNTTVIGIVLIMGIGIGSFNMLASQLGG